jgi:hypothetical protein
MAARLLREKAGKTNPSACFVEAEYGPGLSDEWKTNS